MSNKDELLNQGKILPLMEEFYSIQGEGFYSGTAAYFIRIGGCDVGCHWCDVKESWDEKLHPATSVDLIVKNTAKHAKTAVITGGEPLMWKLDYITEQLQLNKVKTHIETSGAYSFSGKWDWICLSPKKNKLPLDEIYPLADELKIIVYNKHDLIFAQEQASKVRKSCVLYVQPEWSKSEEMTPLLVDFVMKNPHWKISIQQHKYLNIP